MALFSDSAKERPRRNGRNQFEVKMLSSLSGSFWKPLQQRLVEQLGFSEFGSAFGSRFKLC